MLSSVTVVHLVKADGWNEMPFGRDARVVPSNIVLERVPGPHVKGKLGSEFPVRSYAAHCQITLAQCHVFRYFL